MRAAGGGPTPAFQDCSVGVAERFVLQPSPTYTVLLKIASALTYGPAMLVVIGDALRADQPVVALSFARFVAVKETNSVVMREQRPPTTRSPFHTASAYTAPGSGADGERS